MKKAIIIGPAHPLRGGLATFNERLALEFQSKGYEVMIYTFSLQYPSFLFPGKTQFSDEPAPKSLSIKIAVNSINPFNWIRIGLQIRRLKPSIIVLRYWLPFMAPCLGTIARIAKRKHHTKIIAIADNIIPHEKRMGDTLLSTYFVGSCDGFITMSKAVLNDLRTFTTQKPGKYYPHPLYDNYGNALDKNTACSILKLDPNQNYLLFFGFIRDYKGLDILLHAIADERLANMQLKLLVAGEFYTDSQPYYELIDTLGIKDRVLMHDHFIPNSSIPTYFSVADVVVQPYKDATQSGVTQIAYFFDKPMIITNVGGLAELVPHEVVGYVTPPDKTALSEAIQRFYTENKSIDFINNIKSEKKRFSWDGLVKLFETF